MYFAILAFALLLGLMVNRYDVYEKEPWYLILLAVGLGFFASWGIGLAEDLVINAAGKHAGEFWVQSSTAAIMEEGVKLAIVFLIAIGFRRNFNDPMDGLIYGSFIGLGFALFESLLYQSVTVANLQIQMQCMCGEAVRFVLHLLMGGMCGFGIGLARFGVRRWQAILWTWTLSAVAIHFCWDFLCGLPTKSPDSMLLQRFVSVSLLLTAVGLYGSAVLMGLKESSLIHGTGARHSIWGWPFSLLITDASAGPQQVS